MSSEATYSEQMLDQACTDICADLRRFKDRCKPHRRSSDGSYIADSYLEFGGLMNSTAAAAAVDPANVEFPQATDPTPDIIDIGLKIDLCARLPSFIPLGRVPINLILTTGEPWSRSNVWAQFDHDSGWINDHPVDLHVDDDTEAIMWGFILDICTLIHHAGERRSEFADRLAAATSAGFPRQQRYKRTPIFPS